uniref:Pre-B-cell leukemia transcription factor 4 n=1 Tax=Magallana gigas TaxID=29159 RepID=K1RAG1_MAGGI
MASRSSSPAIAINFTTTLEDIIKATIFDDAPPSPQLATSPDNTSVDTTQAETRFDECLNSLFSDHPTPEKSHDLHSDFHLALQCLPLTSPKKIFSDSTISSTEIFTALKSIFRSEADSSTPSVLIKSVQPKISPADREQQLLQRFKTLRSFHPQEINDLSSFFKYQSAQVETDRYCALHQNSNQPLHIRESINQHYNITHHRIMDRVESSLQFLEDNLPTSSPTQTASPQQKTTTKSNLRSRPSLSQKAVQLMEEWYYSHRDNPYPPSHIIQDLARKGGVREEQVKKWFSNKRNRSRRSSGVNKRRSTGVIKSVPCFW